MAAVEKESGQPIVDTKVVRHCAYVYIFVTVSLHFSLLSSESYLLTSDMKDMDHLYSVCLVHIEKDSSITSRT